MTPVASEEAGIEATEIPSDTLLPLRVLGGLRSGQIAESRSQTILPVDFHPPFLGKDAEEAGGEIADRAAGKEASVENKTDCAFVGATPTGCNGT